MPTTSTSPQPKPIWPFTPAACPSSHLTVQFQQALAEAHAARIAAAGGHKMVTEHNIVTARGDAERADMAAQAALRARRQALRRELDRADRDGRRLRRRPDRDLRHPGNTAGIGTIRSGPHPHRRKHRLRPHTLHIPDTALAAYDPAIAQGLKTLAAQPHSWYIRADVTDPDTAAALYASRHRQRRPTKSAGSALPTSRPLPRASLILPTRSPLLPRRINDQRISSGRSHPARSSSSTTPPTPTQRTSPASPTTPPAPTPAPLSSTPPATTAPARRHCGCSTAFLGHHPDRQQSGRGGPPPRRPTPAVTWPTASAAPGSAARWRQLLTEYDTAARAAHRRHVTLSWRTPTAGSTNPTTPCLPANSVSTTDPGSRFLGHERQVCNICGTSAPAWLFPPRCFAH